MVYLYKIRVKPSFVGPSIMRKWTYLIYEYGAHERTRTMKLSKIDILHLVKLSHAPCDTLKSC